MKNLLDYRFWFNLRPDFLLPSSRNFVVGFIALLVFGMVIFSILKKRPAAGLYRPIWNSLFTFCSTNAVIGAILLFFSYELVPLLSARFWMLLWIVGIIVWLGFVIKKLAQIPGLKVAQAEEKKFKQYIP